MSDIQGNIMEEIPCDKPITVPEVSKLLSQFSSLFKNYMNFYDTLELPQANSPELESATGYDKIKLTIEKWVNIKGSKATVGALHDVLETMEEIYICEILMEFTQNRRERTIIIQEIKHFHGSLQPLIQPMKNPSGEYDDQINNNKEDIAMKKLPSFKKSKPDLAMKLPDARDNNPGRHSQYKRSRMKFLRVISSILIVILIIIILYLTGLLQKLVQIVSANINSVTTSTPRKMSPHGQVFEALQLDAKLPPKIVTEDGIMTFIMNSGQYCKKQPRRRIRLHLGELKSFEVPLSNNSTPCLQNIVKFNVTGPLKPEVLTRVLDCTPNLKEIVFYKMEKFCSFSEDYLSHPGEISNDGGQSSVTKLVFHKFLGSCFKGVSILTSVLNTSNLSSIEVLYSDFKDNEINAIRKLVNKSPHLMYFTCCGDKCSKFSIVLNDWVVFMEKDACMILSRR